MSTGEYWFNKCIVCGSLQGHGGLPCPNPPCVPSPTEFWTDADFYKQEAKTAKAEMQRANARVQLLAKALVTCRIALERHRGYSLLEAALTEVDAALAEAGITQEKVG